MHNRMRCPAKFSAAFVGLLALIAGAQPAAAQGPRSSRFAAEEQRFSLAPELGVAIPKAELRDLVKPGLSSGLRLGYAIVPRLSLTVNGELAVLKGVVLTKNVTAPTMRLWSYGLGADAALLPQNWRLALAASASAGFTRMQSESFRPPRAARNTTFRHSYPSVGGQLQLGFSATPNTVVMASAGARRISVNEAETEILTQLQPGKLKPFSSAVTYPITLGLRTRL
jgi:hypothetical protein